MPLLADPVFEGVFFADDDRHAYLNWLKEYSQEHQVDVLASPDDQSYSFGRRAKYRRIDTPTIKLPLLNWVNNLDKALENSAVKV